MRKEIIILFFVIINWCCNKDDLHKYVEIKGNVLNICTGKGSKNLSVKFHHVKNNKIIKDVPVITNQAGNFVFISDINTSDNYTYILSIPGYSNYDTEFFGDQLYLDKNNLNNLNQLYIWALFKKINVHLPEGPSISLPDTINVFFTQDIYHNYVPENPYSFLMNSESFRNDGKRSLSKYPMGWWNIKIDKTKNGVREIIKDSIYLEMGGTYDYTIAW